MSGVISLLTERMKRVRAAWPKPRLVYFCIPCKGELFRISSTGDVVCANPACGALMKNLSVEGKPAA